MSLVNDAHADFIEIMKSDMGAAWDCTITSPAGGSVDFKCRFSDTSQQINPGTNEIATGRQIVVSVLLSELDDAGFLGIKSIPDKTGKPWVVAIDDVIGRSGTYKVVESNPDATLGNMVLWLEKYKELI